MKKSLQAVENLRLELRLLEKSMIVIDDNSRLKLTIQFSNALYSHYTFSKFNRIILVIKPALVDEMFKAEAGH